MAAPTNFMPVLVSSDPLYGTDGDGQDSLAGTGLVKYMNPSNNPNLPHLNEISDLITYLNNQLITFLGTPAGVLASGGTGPISRKSSLAALPIDFTAITQNVWAFLSNANVISLPDMSSVATYTSLSDPTPSVGTALTGFSAISGDLSYLITNIGTLISDVSELTSGGGTSSGPDLASEVLNLQQNQLQLMKDLLALQTFVSTTFESSGISANSLLGKIKVPVYDFGVRTEATFFDYTDNTGVVYVNLSIPAVTTGDNSGTPYSIPYAMTYINPDFVGSPYSDFTFNPLTFRTIYLCSAYTEPSTIQSLGGTVTVPMIVYNDTGLNYTINWTGTTGGQRYFTLSPVNCFVFIPNSDTMSIGTGSTLIAGTNVAAAAPPAP